MIEIPNIPRSPKKLLKGKKSGEDSGGVLIISYWDDLINPFKQYLLKRKSSFIDVPKQYKNNIK